MDVRMNKKISTKAMVQMALFAALLSVSAYISIPLPLPGAPHITLQNFMILLIALLFSPLEGLGIVLVWMLLGAVGIPVFIGGKGGLSYLVANPWAGYTIAFLPVVWLMARFRGEAYKAWWYTVVALCGALVIDGLGMLFLRFYPLSGYNWALAFTGGFLAFLPLDLIKAVAAAQIAPLFRRIM